MNYLATHQWILAAIVIWTLPWKGVALWRAARRKDIGWFIAILILNTLAILEIIYIFFISRKLLIAAESAGESEAVKKKII
jgi:methionyl-tRNA synthetase